MKLTFKFLKDMSSILHMKQKFTSTYKKIEHIQIGYRKHRKALQVRENWMVSHYWEQERGVLSKKVTAKKGRQS